MYGGTWFYPVHQNVIWTLLLGLLGVHLMETVRKKQKLWVSLPVCAAVAAAGALLGTLGMTDYYGAGVLTVFAFYIFRGRKWWCLLGQALTLPQQPGPGCLRRRSPSTHAAARAGAEFRDPIIT